jgi:hypothetical protein
MKSFLFFLLLLPSISYSQFSKGTAITTATVKTASTTWTFNYGGSVSAGKLYVLVFAYDNPSNCTIVSQTNSDCNTSSCLDFTSCSDNAGNSYTIVSGYSNNAGNAALSGANCIVVYSVLTNAVTASNTITLTLANSATAKAVQGSDFSFSGTLNTNICEERYDNGANAGSLTESSLTSTEYLFIRGTAIELNNDNATATGLSTNFSQLAGTNRTGTTGGGANNNMSVMGEYRIVTSTSETSDPNSGASADNASVMIAFYTTSYNKKGQFLQFMNK